MTITGGTGAGQRRLITANAATKLTVSGTWTTTPDATSTYGIAGFVGDNHIHDNLIWASSNATVGISILTSSFETTVMNNAVRGTTQPYVYGKATQSGNVSDQP